MRGILAPPSWDRKTRVTPRRNMPRTIACNEGQEGHERRPPLDHQGKGKDSRIEKEPGVKGEQGGRSRRQTF